MSLITSKSYHDIKLIDYINNLSELDKTQLISNRISNRKLIGIYYNKDDEHQSFLYENVKKYYDYVIMIDLSSNLHEFKLVICLDDTNFALIEKCYNLNILIVSNYESDEYEMNFVKQYCIRYKTYKCISNTINVMNSTDTFSIIVPVYNCEQYIEQTILSILCQTYHNYIIYIIDDCSTDKSLEIINKYSHIPNVVIISNDTNLGKFMSINKVLPTIKTEYYLIVDSDDLIIKNRLVYDLTEFTRYKSILVVASKWYRYDEDMKMLVKTPYYCPNNCTFRIAIIQKIGLYWNTRFSGDSEYFNRFYKFFGKKYIIYSPIITCIAIHRIDKNNLTLQIPLGSKERVDFKLLYENYHNDVYNNLKKNKTIMLVLMKYFI
jgi:hypothetical protein